ncbi:glycosyltransferase [Candidatus Parcubacteria bacterium]|nr:MAG: glycosyltransferase [Candidatus Parcubacteria bacterium]
MTLSWIIPTYREERRIEKSLGEVHAYLERLVANGKVQDYEIIVVDSESPDRTPEIVRNLRSRMPKLSFVSVKNRGKGWGVKEGMRVAKGDVRMFADADNSVSPEQADNFLPLVCGSGMASGECFDIVIGSIEVAGASVEEHAQWYRRLLGKLAKLAIRIVSGLWSVRDSQRGFKFFSKRAAEIIFPRQTLERWGFDFEILSIGKLHGFKIREVPVQWINPPDSKVKLGAYVSTLKELFQVRWNLIRGAYR